MRETLGREDRATPSKTPDYRHCEYKKIVITFNKGKIYGLDDGDCVEYISLRTVEDSKERNWILANVRTI